MAGRGPDVTDEEILEVFSDSDERLLTTSAISEQLPIKQDATYLRLKDLEDAGLIHGKEVGSGYVWWDEATERAFEHAADQWDA